MLSFLRDGKDEDVPGAAQEMGEQDFITVSGKEKSVQRSTILFGTLFAIGVASLLFMIKKSGPDTAVADAVKTEQAQIEQAISRVTGVRTELSLGLDKIVKKFYEFSNVEQVGVEELVKNPFQLDGLSGPLRSAADDDESTAGNEFLKQQRIQRQKGGLDLLSIMQGEGDDSGSCMINDKILNEGDSVDGFTVVSIKTKSVKLSNEGVEVILNLFEE